jgi:glycosyltransferase involved in cell wall biosynthesis/GT2 family glycosyltransferase
MQVITNIVKQKKSKKPAEACVLVTSYNYGDYVTDTLDSVKGQTFEVLDIVVIDDCSTDGSLKKISAWFDLNADRFNSFIVLKNTTNQDVEFSRNTALEYIESEYVFMLDADNIIYPQCIEKLFNAILLSKKDFAYSILERFGSEVRLINLIPWNIEQFQYGNYIDNMALFKRSIFEKVGGYDALGISGWEDFDLFIKIAEAGFSGCHVPEILARYRVHSLSKTQHIENIGKKDSLMFTLRRRHKDFFERISSKSSSEKVSKAHPLKTKGDVRVCYYISNVEEGGAKKFIRDLIACFETADFRFVQIKNKSDMNYWMPFFGKEDILLFQYILFSDLTFSDVIEAKELSGIHLVIQVHDFYFLGETEGDFAHFNLGVHENYLSKKSFIPEVFQLLNTADILIYNSYFVKKIFDSIFYFKNAKTSYYSDYAICEHVNIPLVKKVINIAIINNITVYKGAEYYHKVFAVKKYKEYDICYHVFCRSDVHYDESHIVLHGPYNESEIFGLLKKYEIHGLVFLNKYAETYSYALTKAINSGLAILYSNIGAYKERLQNSTRSFPINDIDHVLTDLNKMFDFIVKNQGMANGSIKPSLNMVPSELHKSIFSVDYTENAHKKYKEKKDEYEQVFKVVEPYAIYFPQFHVLEENRRTFYEGYHDMVNLEELKKQDNSVEVPIKNYLGYYDLQKNREIIPRQITLAQASGFMGFAIYYYWFSENSITGNHMLMREVVDQFFQNRMDNFDVFFIYANESWTGNPAFNQHENNAVIGNIFSPEKITENLNNLVGYFKHTNYKKINNKPVFFIHHPWEMSDEEITRFQTIGDGLLKREGFDGIELVLSDMQKQYPGYSNYSHHPDYKSSQAGSFLVYENGIRYIDYQRYVDEYLVSRTKTVANVESVFYNFNNTARLFFHKDRDILLTKTKNNTHDYFKKFLIQQLNKYVNRQGVSKIFLINSWNEWGEQMAIEPSTELGSTLLTVWEDAIKPIAKQHRTILYVGHDAGSHGAQLLSLYIIKELRESFGFEVILLIRSGGPLEDEYAKYAKVYNLENYKDVDDQKELIGKIRSIGVVYAITNTALTGTIAGMLTDAGFIVVSLIHELPGNIKKFQAEDDLKQIAKKSHHIVFPASFVLERDSEIVGFDRSKVSIIPQGLYIKNKYKNSKNSARRLLRNQLGIGDNTVIVLGVGAGSLRKGVDIFAQVANGVDQKNVYFVWVGDIEDEMKERVASLSRDNDRLFFLPSQESISHYYAGADIFLLTSREDPFPSVVLDAMNVAVPVIGFLNAGGFSDIVTEDTGLLVRYLDVDSMIRGVVSLLRDRDQRKKMGGQARGVIERDFNFKNYVKNILGLLGL